MNKENRSSRNITLKDITKSIESVSGVSKGIEKRSPHNITLKDVMLAIDDVDDSIANQIADAVEGYAIEISPIGIITGEAALTTDAAPLPADKIETDIWLTQSGEGDPAPNNIRPISGSTSLSVYHDEEVPDSGDPFETYAVTFPAEAGTVYGGVFDLVSGTLTVTHKKRIYDGTETWTGAETGLFFHTEPDIITNNASARASTGACSHFKIMTNVTSLANVDKVIMYSNSTYTSRDKRVYVKYTDAGSTANFKAYLAAQAQANTPVEFVYKLATPLVYHVSPVRVNMLRGINAVWSNPGNTTLTYRRDLTKLILPQSAATTERPTENLTDGYMLFDTTLGKPIWYFNEAWVDAAGDPADGTAP